MSETIKRLAAIGKKHCNHSEDRHIELGRIVQAWQQFPGGPDNAPADIKRAGLRAKETFFKENLMLVVKAYNKYLHLHQACCISDSDDMAVDICIGYNRAIERYEPLRGTRFSTICVFWLRQAAWRHIDRHRSPISIPGQRLQQLRNLQKGRITSDDITPRDKRLMNCAYNVLRVGSLDARLKNDGEDGDTYEIYLADDKNTCEIEDLDTPWQRFQGDHPEDAALLLSLTEGRNCISKIDRKKHRVLIDKLREYVALM